MPSESNPFIDSSRMRKLGRVKIAIPIPNLCFIPIENFTALVTYQVTGRNSGLLIFYSAIHFIYKSNRTFI